MTKHVDVVVVGAGLSGVGAAARFRRHLPHASVAVLESRGTIGGTWDLFRYPGVRSDSDMFTLGYPFRPWGEAKAIADGDAIRRYVVETADAEGVTPLIRFRRRVVGADWHSTSARWTLTVRVLPGGAGEWVDEHDGAGTTETLTCSFLLACTGYYRYDRGYTPDLPGLDRFAGPVVHPQHWPADLDLAGRRIVVIGSGATAITLLPALAAAGAHPTMLQRSPTYVGVVPSRDRLAERLAHRLPAALAHRIVRWKNVAASLGLYELSRRRPATMKALLTRGAAAKLPFGFDLTHFTPSYDPWDQRLCAAPDGDLFRAIREGTADVVTDRIRTVTEHGVALESGATLDADVLVTATGLDVLAIGGMRLVVDGRPIELAETVAYKGTMLSGVPNFALAVGYTNASWTLKADLVARYLVRVLLRMRRLGYDMVTPVVPERVRREPTVPLIDLASGYIRRGLGRLPRQGARTPWRLRQSYPHDVARLLLGPVTDDVRFDRAPGATAGRTTTDVAAARVPEPVT